MTTQDNSLVFTGDQPKTRIRLIVFGNIADVTRQHYELMAELAVARDETVNGYLKWRECKTLLGGYDRFRTEMSRLRKELRRAFNEALVERLIEPGGGGQRLGPPADAIAWKRGFEEVLIDQKLKEGIMERFPMVE